jgi:DNA processing protein
MALISEWMEQCGKKKRKKRQKVLDSAGIVRDAMCFAVQDNVTNKNSWRPNTLIKQGAKLVATWEDVWEDLPAEVRLALTPTASPESSASSSASLFPDDGLPPHEKRILGLLKADESTHIDEIVELPETELSSSEIFVALFELELAGKVR